jgi:protease-4
MFLNAKQAKPVVVSMGDVAASGGYYIACPANYIIADKGTITGSIGVFGIVPNIGKLCEKKLGITMDVAKTNDHSDFPNIMRPFDAQEKIILQYEVDKVYNEFVSRVSKGRNIDVAKVDEIAQGRVWSSVDALKIGLIDSIGGLNDAIAKAAKMAGLTNYRRVNLPEMEDTLEKILKELTAEVKTNVIKSELGESYEFLKTYQKIARMKGVQTMLPYELNIY